MFIQKYWGVLIKGEFLMSKQSDTSNLPKFITEDAKAEYDLDMEKKTPWMTKNLHKMMIGFSIVWFAIILLYITKFFGWSNLFLMMPDEFGGFLAGVTLPLAIIWVIMAYIDRGTTFKNEAKFLRAYLNQMIYPQEGGSNTAKALTDAIRQEVVKLQEITQLANQQTKGVREELSHKTDEFAKLLSTLNEYSNHAMNGFSSTIHELTQNFDIVCQKAQDSASVLKENIGQFEEYSNTLAANSKNIFDKILPNIKEMKTATSLLKDISEDNNAKIEDANKMLDRFANSTQNNLKNFMQVIQEQAEKIKQITDYINNGYAKISQTIDGSITGVDKSLRQQQDFMNSQMSQLDKKSEALATKFIKYGEEITLEIDKVAARADILEETIALQTANLTGVSEKISENLNDCAKDIHDKTTEFGQLSENLTSKLHDHTEIVSDDVLRVSQNLETIKDFAERIDEAVQNRFNAITQYSQNVINTITDLHHQVLEKSDAILANTRMSLQEFDNINAMVEKYDTKFTETTTLLATQNQISEASLGQQHKLISNSLTALETSKSEIRNQVEELSRTANMINQEAGAAIKALQDQMKQALDYSENVVSQTVAINNNMAKQAIEFDKHTSDNMEKLNRFEGVLNNHYKQIDISTNKVSDRTKEISQMLSDQISNIERAFNDTARQYNEILTTFEDQNKALNAVAESTVNYVAEVVQTFDDKAQAINLLFKQQENEFYDICDKISDNATSITNNVKKQVASIEQNTEKVFARMSMLQEDINSHTQTITSNSLASMDKLAQMDKEIMAHNDTSAQMLQTLEENLARIFEVIPENINNISNTMMEVKDTAILISSEINNNCSQLQNCKNDIMKEAKEEGIMYESQIKRLDSLLSKSLAQSNYLKEVLDHQKDSLTDIVNIVSTQTKLGEASLAQQYKILSDAAVEVSKKMSEINTQFKDNTNIVIENSAKVAYEIDVLGDKLLKTGEDVVKSSKQSSKEIEKYGILLSNSSQDFSSAVTSSVSKLDDAMKIYNKYLSDFNTVTAETSSGVYEINNMITSQSDKMLHISEDTKELVNSFNNILNDTSVTLSNRAQEAFDKVKGLATNLKTLSIELDEASKMTEQRLQNSGEKLRSSIAEIATNAERISNDILNSGEVFLKQSGVLVATTQETISKVGNTMNEVQEAALSLDTQGEGLMAKAQNFKELIHAQINALIDTSSKTDKQLDEMKKAYADVSADSFLNSASQIIEKLESIAVDINRIFNPSAEEELWKKYYAGDVGAFIRYLSKNMSKQQVMSIRKEFEKNLEFRNVVSRYLSEFETLISRAQNNDKAEVLLSVISGADIGKVYYILAKALDKIQ